jgi:hypothetical protein
MHRAGVDVAAEDGPEGDPHGDDDKRDDQVVLECSGPRRIASPLGNDESEDTGHHQKQDRIRRETHCRSKT